MSYTILIERWPTFLVLIGFSLIHFVPNYERLSFLSKRSLISFSAGVGVSYVTLNLFPYLSYSQALLNDSFGWSVNSIFGNSVYLAVLLGFTIFYVINKYDEKEMVKLEKDDPKTFKEVIFDMEITFYALYNAMIGYLVASGSMGSNTNLLIYFIAFGLHFLLIAWVLCYHHEHKYDRVGGAVLAISIILGGVFAIFLKLPTYLVVFIKAFITGAMTLNVIKFELPGENQGSLRGFLFGVVLSAILFLLI